MAATPENKVKKQVKSLLDLHNAYHHWPVQAGYGMACLDCHGCHQSEYFAVETKAPGKHPTPRQEIVMRDIQRTGGVVFVIGERVDGKGNYSGMTELAAWLNRKSK